MIFKALKTKRTKEFVTILDDELYTGSIPKLFPITFDLDFFKSTTSFDKEQLDDLYVVLVNIQECEIN